MGRARREPPVPAPRAPDRQGPRAESQRPGDGRAVLPTADAADSLLFLQRTVGNREVQRALAAGADAGTLRIEQAGDAAEREAEQTESRVAAAPAHRRPGHAGDRSHEHPDGQATVPPALQAHIDQARSGGQSLPDAVRSTFESQLHQDLSGVRIHTDAAAASSARAAGARAYTVGHDVVFAANQYAPDTPAGQALIGHELTHAAQQGAAGQVVQRSPDRQTDGQIQSYVFAGDKRLATDQTFAAKRGHDVAARIRQSGALSSDLRLELNSMLGFFAGDAKDVYIAIIKPALVEASGKDIEMPAEEARPQDPWAQWNMLRNHPSYIDNNITKVSFYTAELAEVHYQDGSTLRLGLVPRWMEAPVQQVDYHTPEADFRLSVDKTTGYGLLRESQMAAAPRGMPWGEVQRLYTSPLAFYADGKSGRILPSIVNAKTAPTLTRVLLDSERRFVEQAQWAAHWGTQVAGVVGAMGGGTFTGGGGVAVPRVASRLGMSRAAKQLLQELEDVLVAGTKKTVTVKGVAFSGVRVVEQRGVLQISRDSIERVAAAKGQGGVVSEAFEDAAAALARARGLKTVTINVGRITNPGWREIMEAAGYQLTRTDTARGGFIIDWIKTIHL